MNSEPFPSLRSGYLRAVARAWRDPKYARMLCEESKKERNGVLRHLEREYGFRFAFDIKFAVDESHSPEWNPLGGGWVGASDAFKIYLPKAPSDPTRRAEALARYYEAYPSMLGRPRDPELLSAQAPDDFAEFGGITLRALALSWEDPHFAKLLFAATDARRLIEDYFDYGVVWNFKLRFEQLEEPPAIDGGNFASFPPNEVLVHLPKRPVSPGHGPEDVRLEPVALAAYNDTGPRYPFTCG